MTDVKRNYYSRMIWAWAVIVGLSLGTLGIAVLDRRDSVSFNVLPILPNPAVPGRNLLVSWRIKPLRPGCGGIVRRHITTSDMRDWQLGEAAVGYQVTDEDRIFTREVPLPTGAADGPAVYRVQALRWCNSLQQLLWPMKDESIGPIYFNIKCPVAREPDGECLVTSKR